ncbi:hypothetical protein DWZ60_16185 [Blautia sp. AF34-10]|nr:hypothetical protein DWZ60_16185 [Blautia sp. AF34-10]
MIVSYITMEIWTGIWILVRLLPTALIIFAGVMIIELGIEFIQKKKIEIRILNWNMDISEVTSNGTYYFRRCYDYRTGY